jgi:two-component system, NtrC family, sensor kinase
MGVDVGVAASADVLRGLIALSRQIMQLSTRAIPRLEFLRDLSTLLLDFSKCELVELRLYGTIAYRVRASRASGASFDFEAFSAGPSAPGADAPDRLRQLVGGALAGALEPTSGRFTPYGSFWTGDVAASPSRSVEGDAIPITLVPGAASLALIPFPVNHLDAGVLRLENVRPDAFRREVIESYEAVAETLGLAIAQRRAQAALRERVKELGCLYAIARVIERDAGDTGEVLDRIVQLLPPAWQYPEIAVARVTVDGVGCATGDVARARTCQRAPIVVDGRPRGEVEVGYVEEIPHAVDGPFLREEEHLIGGIALAIGEFLERRDAAGERARLQEQLRHADRLATIGQLAAGVAHEINEPLGGILGFAQLAGRGSAVPEDTHKDLDRIVASCLQAREIVKKLQAFARQAPMQRRWVSVPAIVDEALGLVAARCASGDVQLIRRMGDTPDVWADPTQLKQVVVNLVVNALQAMPKGGTLTAATRSDRGAVLLEIADTGIGMAPDVIDQIFNPFFTTKDVGEGTGLGLAVVHGIVSAHGGAIEVMSAVGSGTTFRVRLPADGGGAPGDGDWRPRP